MCFNADFYSYLQLAPVAYMVKLNIELSMAELISRIVGCSQKIDVKDYSTNCKSRSDIQAEKTFMESDATVDPSAEQYKGEGITKTVTMLNNFSSANSDGGSMVEPSEINTIMERNLKQIAKGLDRFDHLLYSKC